MTDRQILFQMQQIGHIIKVVAIDSLTGTEITIQGPASASRAILQQNARKKLEYVLNKQKTGA
jgi:hypothetical protein